MPELYDTQRALSIKIRQLSGLIKESNYTVVLTGAGISTAANIPDFRSPNGLWTKEKKEKNKQKKEIIDKQKWQKYAGVESGSSADSKSSEDNDIKNPSLAEDFTFADATPTLTHRSITRLVMDRKIKYCITQNVDGLHRRSGLSRKYHSTVHGCVFTEKCARLGCGCEYFGDVEQQTLSFKPTGNKCKECQDGGDLRDTLLDWEDPVLEMERVKSECEKAELIICIGTSLRILPIGKLPLLAKRFVVINLQATPIDKKACLIIRAKADDIMSRLMGELDYERNWGDDVSLVEKLWKPTSKENEEWEYIIENYETPLR